MLLGLPLLLLLLAEGRAEKVEDVRVDLATAIHRVSDGYISFAIDAEWFGPPESKAKWAPVRMDLESRVLRAMVKLVAPAHLRVGGTYSDYIVYDVGSPPPSCPASWNETMCPGNSWPCCLPLKLERWTETLDFAALTGTRLGLNINELYGRGFPKRGTVTNATWDPTNAREFIEWTVQHVAPSQLPVMYGLGNELWNILRPEAQAHDFVTLHGIIEKTYGETHPRPFLFGPDMWDSPTVLESFDEAFMRALPPGILGAYAYHLYTGHDSTVEYLETTLVQPAFHDEYEARLAAHRAMLERTYPGAQLWITESASSAIAPHNGPASEGMLKAVDSLWYSCALGAAASHRHDVFCRETLAGDWLESLASYWPGHPADIAYHPHPDFWVAVFFRKVMGQRVLNVTSGRVARTLRAFVHCAPSDKEATIAALVVNIANVTQHFRISQLGGITNSTQWLLTPGPDLASDTMLLNGHALWVDREGTTAPLDGVHVAPSEGGILAVPPLSILFAHLDMGQPVPACSPTPGV